MAFLKDSFVIENFGAFKKLRISIAFYLQDGKTWIQFQENAIHKSLTLDLLHNADIYH
jgi:hypothetical protein